MRNLFYILVSDSDILTLSQAFLELGDLLISTDINAALDAFKTVSAVQL